MQDRFYPLMSIPAIITAAILTKVENDFLELVFFIDVGMSLCHYADAGYYISPFHLNS